MASRSRPGELRREHRVQVRLGVAADGGVARVQGDVLEVVQAGEQAHLGEPAHPREQGEPNVGVAELDGPVQVVQVAAVGAGEIRRLQRVQDGLVVLVDQHDDGPLGALAQRPDQMGEALGRPVVLPDHGRPAFERAKLRHRVPVQVPGPGEIAAAEVQAHHGVAGRQGWVVLGGESPEQLPAALEQLLDGVHQEALAEAPGT